MAVDIAVPGRVGDATRQHGAVSITATEARQQFFTLLADVLADPTAIVFIEHKDLPGRAMLVSDAYQDYVQRLETLVASLLDSETPLVPGFRLAGSMEVGGDQAAALAKSRADATRRSAHKFDAL